MSKIIKVIYNVYSHQQAVEYGVRKVAMSATRSLTLETLAFSAVSGLLSFLQRTSQSKTCLPWYVLLINLYD
jgi:hypothetical protein